MSQPVCTFQDRLSSGLNAAQDVAQGSHSHSHEGDHHSHDHHAGLNEHGHTHDIMEHPGESDTVCAVLCLPG